MYGQHKSKLSELTEWSISKKPKISDYSTETVKPRTIGNYDDHHNRLGKKLWKRMTGVKQSAYICIYIYIYIYIERERER